MFLLEIYFSNLNYSLGMFILGVGRYEIENRSPCHLYVAEYNEGDYNMSDRTLCLIAKNLPSQCS